MGSPYTRLRNTGFGTYSPVQATCKSTSSTYAWRTSPAGWRLTSSSDVAHVRSHPGGYDYRTMTDVVTPGFDRLMSNGFVICNDAEWLITSRKTCGEGYQPKFALDGIWIKPNKYKAIVQYYGDVSATDVGLADSDGLVRTLGVQDPAFEVSDDELRYAVTDAYGQASKAPINLWVTAGELNETIQTVQSAVQAAAVLLNWRRKYPTQYRHRLLEVWRGRAYDGTRLSWRDLKAFPNHWLAVRYGWRPIVREIQSGLRAIRNLSNKNRKRFSTARSWDNTTEGTTTYDGASNFSGSNYINYSLHCKRSRKVSVRGGVLVQPTFENTTAADLLGLGNMAEAAWDLVPYSFCIQWVANVSSWISRYSPKGLLKPIANWGIIEVEDLVDTSVMCSSCVPTYGGYGNLQAGSSCSLSGRAVSKTVSYRRISSPPGTAFPEVRISLRAANLVDAGSLLAQFWDNLY